MSGLKVPGRTSTSNAGMKREGGGQWVKVSGNQQAENYSCVQLYHGVCQ